MRGGGKGTKEREKEKGTKLSPVSFFAATFISSCL